MKTKLDKILEEKGSASIVEYSIVLPICLIVLLFIFTVGYMLNQRAVLDAAATRAILIAQKVYADPKYSEIILLDGSSEEKDIVGYKDRDTLNKKIESDPYRYFFNNYKSDMISNLIEKKVLDIVKKNQLVQLDPRVSEVTVTVPSIEGILWKKASVVVKQDYYVPILLGHLKIYSGIQMVSKASVAIVSPAELLRNVDFVVDIVEDVSGNDVTQTLVDFFGKISSFFKESK